MFRGNIKESTKYLLHFFHWCSSRNLYNFYLISGIKLQNSGWNSKKRKSSTYRRVSFRQPRFCSPRAAVAAAAAASNQQSFGPRRYNRRPPPRERSLIYERKQGGPLDGILLISFFLSISTSELDYDHRIFESSDKKFSPGPRPLLPEVY